MLLGLVCGLNEGFDSFGDIQELFDVELFEKGSFNFFEAHLECRNALAARDECILRDHC
jgi:hypothetical protein